jgi:hypothetical protein
MGFEPTTPTLARLCSALRHNLIVPGTTLNCLAADVCG